MHQSFSQLRLWLTMPDNVMMVAAVTPKDTTLKQLTAEIAVYRKNFDAGPVTSPHVKESDFGEYRVRVMFPKECAVEIDDWKIISAGAELQNFKDKRAFILRPAKSIRNHLVLIVMGNERVLANLDETFRKSAYRLLDGLSLAFTPP